MTPQNVDHLSQHVNENIESIISFQQREQQKLSRLERSLDRVSGLVGRPCYLIALLVIAVLWISFNLLAPAAGLLVFDPAPFPLLHGLLTLAALVTATIVLIAQQRLARLENQRAHLDLQVNLLTEQKVTKVIHLLEELRRDLPMVRDRHDSEATELQQPTDTAQVLSALQDIGVSGRAEPKPKRDDG
jgi:uncharacterized membrane protein